MAVWKQGWKYRRQIFFLNPPNNPSGGGFVPWPVVLTATFDQYDSPYYKAKADGTDICFTEIDGTTLLPFEMASWGGEYNKTGTFFVRTSVIPRDEPGYSNVCVATCYMYWGSQDTDGSVDSMWYNYVGVWHFGDHDGFLAGIGDDSSSVGNDAVSHGFPAVFNDCPLLGCGFRANSSSSKYFEAAHNEKYDFRDFIDGTGYDMTTSLLVRSSQAAASGKLPMILSKDAIDTATREGWNISLHFSTTNSGKWFGQGWAGGSSFTKYGNNDIADGEWHYISFRRSRNYELDPPGLYGWEDNTTAGAGVAWDNFQTAITTAPLRFGGPPTGTIAPSNFHFSGDIAEVRISRSLVDEISINFEASLLLHPEDYITFGICERCPTRIFTGLSGGMNG